MPVWKVSPVESEPDMTLVRWRIFETPSGDRHFVGLRADDLTGRVSTVIRILDLSKRRGLTSSGRTYGLKGGPGVSADADYIWNAWCRVNGIDKFTDVTANLLSGSAALPTANRTTT